MRPSVVLSDINALMSWKLEAEKEIEMPKEKPSLRRHRPGHELTPERLFSILNNMYGEELARKFYHELTGQKVPGLSYDEKEDQNG